MGSCPLLGMDGHFITRYHPPMSTRTIWGAVLAATPLTGVWACSSSDQAAAPSPITSDAGVDAPGAEDAEASAPTLGWKKCPGPVGRAAECVKMDMPLDWSNPSGKTIPVLVQRSLAAKQPASVALWELPGGPGQASSLENLTPKELADYDLYTIDFRGSGQSSPLECNDIANVLGWFEPQDVAKVADCGTRLKAKWGDDLRHFSTTNAARDLAEAMRQTAAPGQKRFLLGISFGTLLAQRLLQVAPELVEGVILDSIVAPTGSAIMPAASWDGVLATVLESCAAKDAVCREKLGPKATQVIDDLRAKLALPTSHCPTSRNLTPRHYRRLIGAALGGNLFSPLPALLYRINRCDPADEPAILKFVDRVKPFADDAGSIVNIGLFFHITFSELVSKDDPSAEAAAAAENASVASVHEAVAMRMAKDVWPAAPPDPLDDAYASTTMPMLFLSGTFDPRTPPAAAQEVKSHFPGEKQSLVSFAGYGHNPFPTFSCPRAIVTRFIENPTARVDRTCADVDNTVYGNASQAMTFFGTQSYWDNP